MLHKVLIKIMVILGLFVFAANAQSTVFKIATLAPDGSIWMKKMREGAKEIAIKTGNGVRFKFYPGGVMGDDKSVLRKIRIGQLHGSAVTTGSWPNIYPDKQIYSLPLKFKSFAEVDYVRKQMDPFIIKGLEKNGWVTFGFSGGGFAYILSRTPILNIKDLRNQKIWIPENDIMSQEIVKSFGVSPIPLSFAEVRTGLQTGLINTITTSPIGAITLQWHTQVNYLLDFPLLYLYGFLAIDAKAFGRISATHQQVMRDVMGRVFEDIGRQNRKDNDKALDALRKQGIQFIKPPAETIRRWKDLASVVSTRLIEKGNLSKQIFDMLNNHLAAISQK